MAHTKLIRVCCRNTDQNKELLRSMGYRMSSLLFEGNNTYWTLNIWTLEAWCSSKPHGLVLYPETLACIALLPTIDAVEAYIYMLQDEAAASGLYIGDL